MNQARNPYAPPTAAVEDPSPQRRDLGPLIENGRRVPIGKSVQWISETFDLFFQNPWKWIGSMLLLFLMWIVVSLVPFSNLFSAILWPVFAGGIAYALDQQRQIRSFRLANVFAGFGQSFLPLAAVGCATLLSYLIMFAVFFVMVGSDAAMAVALGGNQLSTIPPNFWNALIVSTVLALPLTAATFLSAPLIMLHGVSPFRAMKMSFFGCLKNILPWTLLGILMALIILLSSIPLLLGLFVTLPVAVMAFYSMYRDIFVDELREQVGASASQRLAVSTLDQAV